MNPRCLVQTGESKRLIVLGPWEASWTNLVDANSSPCGLQQISFTTLLCPVTAFASVQA